MAVIPYDPTTPFGNRTAAAVQAIKLAQSNVARLVDMANEVTGGGVTFSGLEDKAGNNYFGVTSGQGQNFYNAIAALNTALFQAGGTRTPIQASIDLDRGI